MDHPDTNKYPESESEKPLDRAIVDNIKSNSFANPVLATTDKGITHALAMDDKS